MDLELSSRFASSTSLLNVVTLLGSSAARALNYNEQDIRVGRGGGVDCILHDSKAR